jgi:hypothetical protein
MGDLKLKGNLMLGGQLQLQPSGGKTLVGDSELEALVENAEGTGVPPVILPPPPATPIDDGTTVKVISSFNKTVTTNGNNLVTQGIVMQGNVPTWPGMMLPSIGNSTGPSVNGIKINIMNDQASIFPSGGIGTFDSNSGQ